MKDKAGQMGSGMAWAFAIGSAIVAGGLGFAIQSSGLTWLLGLILFIGGGWAAVYLTKASTGMGILAFLVAGIIAGILTYFALKSAVSAATGALTDTMGQMGKGMGANADAQKQFAQAGAAMQSGFGAMVGIIGFVVALLRTFILGMIGCFIGGSMKKSALGGGAAPARAA
jgi:hypothetical protein